MTRGQEAAHIWRERLVIAKTVPKLWECCLHENGFGRCNVALVESTVPATEGMCHIVQYVFRVRY